MECILVLAAIIYSIYLKPKGKCWGKKSRIFLVKARPNKLFLFLQFPQHILWSFDFSFTTTKINPPIRFLYYIFSALHLRKLASWRNIIKITLKPDTRLFNWSIFIMYIYVFALEFIPYVYQTRVSSAQIINIFQGLCYTCYI